VVDQGDREGERLRVARVASPVGGSAAVQTAIEGTKAAAEGATAAGRIANDLSGAGGFTPSTPSSGSGAASDLPAPPRLASATVGESYENPSNPAQVAHQTEPHSFTVTDEVRGTISYYKGNIFAPYAAQAAFNAHSSKAQPIEPPPLPAAKKV
jgi:hypothetical protein